MKNFILLNVADFKGAYNLNLSVKYNSQVNFFA